MWTGSIDFSILERKGESMTGISYYKEKTQYLYIHQGGKCAITGKPLGNPAVSKWDLHHKLESSKVNKYRFPRLINSLWNLVLVDHNAHMSSPHPGMTVYQAEGREAFLECHPKISWFLNYLYEPGVENG